MLEAKNIHKSYQNGNTVLHVLKGIDLHIKKGEAVSILGPSGAGKSTLLHILGGLDEPTKGEVILEGLKLYKLGDTKRAEVRNRRVGFVFQFYHLLPEFSALENVMLPALIGRQSPVASRQSGCGRRPETGDRRPATDRARELLELVGLGRRLRHRPGELSGGEQQRTAIARALMNEPQLLLCDEPTGNLDSESGRGIIELLYRLNKENGTTVVIVTHDEEIAKRADRQLHIRDGRLESR